MMKRTIFALATGLSIGALLSAQTARGEVIPVQGARNCAPHAVVVERLAAGYGESRQSIALGANNTVVEIFASLETGSWTMTVTTPGGPTCLVASGQAFEHLGEALPNTDPGA